MPKFSKIILVGFAIGVICLFVKSANDRKEIEEHPGQTICKYTLCRQSGRSSDAYVKYYVDNKLHRTRAGGCPKNSEEKINKYFVIKYSTIDPDNILVDFENEVKDSLLIKELESKLEFKYWLDH
ncbi:hypothetical protein [Flavobacterium daemonense]|uniref:hypothetical protein n=1 Tax=Flavobacterium daemonense TaxID=1393049 RepID=UPI001185999B|nr:hypothetical protein [Flavobacterium daemonense]KAF2328573.1 hypothetical protein FND99_17460 [Flavobacterium daemonense]